jgi:hypothetical protein
MTMGLTNVFFLQPFQERDLTWDAASEVVLLAWFWLEIQHYSLQQQNRRQGIPF